MLKMKKINDKMIYDFKNHLIEEEKSDATIEKYLRDITSFVRWLSERPVSKAIILEYKKLLMKNYATASVNSIISSLNRFFVYLGLFDCKVKTIKVQRQIFASKDKELTKAEYERLLTSAKNKNNQKLYYLMQTICATGIRISELKFLSIEAVNQGVANINCKGKQRKVWIPKNLCKMLKIYAKEQGIETGSIFVSKTGRPLDRSNVWKMLKSLCEDARVSKDKVFPHNLRHLFARSYYSLHKDIIRLADLLGHSSVNTTRLYTMESGDVHRKQISKLGLIAGWA